MFKHSSDCISGVIYRKLFSLFVCSAFISTSLVPPSYAQSVFNLPQPGAMVSVSEAFAPVVLKGVTIHPEDPLLFDFIVDNGQSGLKGQGLTDETTKLVKYFLAGLAVPEKDLWVNLSPREQDRIMADELSHTDVGRDMLAQDYMLKQVTASLMYPEKDLGRKFWDEVYKRSYEKFGNTNIPVDTFNKVWIMPAEATVYQNGNNAIVAQSHLKVMLEADYEVMSHQRDMTESLAPLSGDVELAKDVVREVILPVLEKEVNEGRNFASLRQVFASMILAGWYKNALKESLLAQVYSNTNKVNGIEIAEKDAREKVYAQYMEAYQKGVYNYIKEEFDQNTNETMPRKYFSGGVTWDAAMAPKVTSDASQVLAVIGESDTISYKMQAVTSDAAQRDFLSLEEQVEFFRKNIQPGVFVVIPGLGHGEVEGVFGDEVDVTLVAGTQRQRVSREQLFPESEIAVDAAQAVLPRVNPIHTGAWELLKRMAGKEFDLRKMFAEDPDRVKNMTIALNDEVEVDFSKNLVDRMTLSELFALARAAGLENSIELMFTGAKINETENRAVLHTALRNVKRDEAGKLVAVNGPVYVDGKDVMPEVIAVLEKMELFTQKVQSGAWRGASGKKIKYMVNVGIGGSDLGPKMAAEALKPYKAGDLEVFFLSNVDGTAAAELMKKLDPEETLVNIVSKTFTTQETMQNAQTLKEWVLKAYNGDTEVIKKHFIASSTAKKLVEEFGIDSNNMFEFWDWVGGRYSVWSAVGLTLATYIGFDNFLEFLQGGREADEHFRSQSFDKNIPVIKGMLDVWYGNFLGVRSSAILPYDQYLGLFPAFTQQFFMESLGKRVDRNGDPVNYSTGLAVWGAPGTDGQHSFYQMIHQGTALIPADFIGVINTHNPLPGHHDKFFSNYVAQTEALAFGLTQEEALAALKDKPDAQWLSGHKTFSGNKPTTSILLDKVTPRTLGNLVAMYEHQIFVESVVWNIFAFDQWGVELGKKVATDKVMPSIKDASRLPVSGLSLSGQRAIERFNAKKDAAQAMSWETLQGDPDFWIDRVVNQKLLALADDKDDKYRDYDYRSMDGLKPELGFVMALAWAKMEKEKMAQAGITKKTVLVARDARKIEPELVDAQIAAFRYAGFDVVFMGAEQPNCVTSYSWGMQQFQPVMSVFETASHVARPPEEKVRGVKVTQQSEHDGVANSLSTEEIKEVSRSIVTDLITDVDKIKELKSPVSGDFKTVDVNANVVKFNTAIGFLATQNGSLYEFGETIRHADDPLAVVEDYLAKNVSSEKPLVGMKIVVKGAHTPSGPIAVETFKQLGAEVFPLQNDIREIDGMHDADPSIESNIGDLKEEIIRTGAHFGIAFDLDGDRGLILVAEKNAEGEVVKWHPLSPDNLLGMLAPDLIQDWGYNASGKQIGVIKDVLGTNGVTDVGEKLGILVVQTDAGYVFLKAAKAEYEKKGYVFPIYGEKSGHTWLHVAGEIENPLAVAILVAVKVKREMKADSLNQSLEVYRSSEIPYSASPRFQPPFHPVFLAELGDMPENRTGWKFDTGNRAAKIPQAIIALGKKVAIDRLKQTFQIGRTFETAVGALKVSAFDDGKGRYADIRFEKDGVFVGHVVFRASSNDPSFVMTYEAPVLGGDMKKAVRYRQYVSGIVLKFLSDKEIALFTKENIRQVMPHLNDEEAENVFKKGNLAPVSEDLKAFDDENDSPLDYAQAEDFETDEDDDYKPGVRVTHVAVGTTLGEHKAATLATLFLVYNMKEHIDKLPIEFLFLAPEHVVPAIKHLTEKLDQARNQKKWPLKITIDATNPLFGIVVLALVSKMCQYAGDFEWSYQMGSRFTQKDITITPSRKLLLLSKVLPWDFRSRVDKMKNFLDMQSKPFHHFLKTEREIGSVKLDPALQQIYHGLYRSIKNNVADSSSQQKHVYYNIDGERVDEGSPDAFFQSVSQYFFGDRYYDVPFSKFYDAREFLVNGKLMELSVKEAHRRLATAAAMYRSHGILRCVLNGEDVAFIYEQPLSKTDPVVFNQASEKVQQALVGSHFNESLESRIINPVAVVDKNSYSLSLPFQTTDYAQQAAILRTDMNFEQALDVFRRTLSPELSMEDMQIRLFRDLRRYIAEKPATPELNDFVIAVFNQLFLDYIETENKFFGAFAKELNRRIISVEDKKEDLLVVLYGDEQMPLSWSLLAEKIAADTISDIKKDPGANLDAAQRNVFSDGLSLDAARPVLMDELRRIMALPLKDKWNEFFVFTLQLKSYIYSQRDDQQIRPFVRGIFNDVFDAYHAAGEKDEKSFWEQVAHHFYSRIDTIGEEGMVSLAHGNYNEAPDKALWADIADEAVDDVLHKAGIVTSDIKGGIDLGSGNYLKIIATDQAGMLKFDPSQLQQLRKDLRGIVPVPVGAPVPVNLRPLLGLDPNSGNDDLDSVRIDGSTGREIPA